MTAREPKALLRLAFARADEGRHREACRLAARAGEIAPDDPLVLCAYAEVLHASGRDRDARKVATDAVSIAPRLPLAHATLGLASLSRRRTGPAERALREALRLDPRNRTARANLNAVLRRKAARRPWHRRAEPGPRVPAASAASPEAASRVAARARIAGAVLLGGWALAAAYAVGAASGGDGAARIAARTFALLLLTLVAWIATRECVLRLGARRLSADERRALRAAEQERAWRRWLVLLGSALAAALLWIALWAHRPDGNSPHGLSWELVSVLFVAAAVAAVKLAEAVHHGRAQRRAGSAGRGPVAAS